MNYPTNPVSCHPCCNHGYLKNEEATNLIDGLPDLEKSVPDDVLMSLVCVALYPDGFLQIFCSIIFE